MKKMIFVFLLIAISTNAFSQAVDIGPNGIEAFFNVSIAYFLTGQSPLRNNTNFLGGMVQFRTDTNGIPFISWGKTISSSEIEMYTNAFSKYVEGYKLRKVTDGLNNETLGFFYTPKYELIQAGVKLNFHMLVTRGDEAVIAAMVGSEWRVNIN